MQTQQAIRCAAQTFEINPMGTIHCCTSRHAVAVQKREFAAHAAREEGTGLSYLAWTGLHVTHRSLELMRPVSKFCNRLLGNGTSHDGRRIAPNAFVSDAVLPQFLGSLAAGCAWAGGQMGGLVGRAIHSPHAASQGMMLGAYLGVFAASVANQALALVNLLVQIKVFPYAFVIMGVVTVFEGRDSLAQAYHRDSQPTLGDFLRDVRNAL